MATLTTVTYHFVRRLQGSAYPRLKARELDAFEEQLHYLQAHYRIVSMAECFAALSGLTRLPERSLLLTFDDAYRDHYEFVWPRLKRAGLSAAFFPPAKAIECREVLDVNKIHFVLASQARPGSLVKEIFRLLDRHREIWCLESNRDYWDRLAKPFRWDGKDIVFIKRLLQRELPLGLRQQLVDTLFRKHVTDDEASFARQLYVSEAELAEMVAEGAYVGSHGYDHFWLGALAAEAQREEIDHSLAFLNRLGVATDRWAIAYPFGSYNRALLDICRERGAVLGFTTERGVADWGTCARLELPRLDTNDVPCSETEADKQGFVFSVPLDFAAEGCRQPG